MIDYKDFLCKNSNKFSNQKIRYMSEDDKNNLTEQTSFLSPDTPLLVRLVTLKDGFSHYHQPKCGYCQKVLNRIYQGKMIRYCGPKCYSQTEEFKDNLKKVDHSRANTTRRQTMLDRYGVEFNLQREDVKSILRKSSLEVTNDEALKVLQSKESLQDLHINQKKSSLTISKELGVYYGTVKDWIEKHEIKYHYYSHDSQYERLIQQWLSEFQIEYKTNVRDILAPKELDIWIPSHNLAIEINGFYWHGAKRKEELPLAQFRHQKKTLECREKGIALIHLSDLQLKNESEKIKHWLKLRLDNVRKISARKCDIRLIDVGEAKPFCEHLHLQGYSGASIKLGIFYKNSLVGVMTFSKSRFNQSCWEIVTSCSNIRIVGGVSKLIKYFIDNQMKSGEKLISYVNLSYGFNGVSYEKSRMVFSNITTPGYIWIGKDEQIFSRYQMQSHRIKKYFPDYTGETEDSFLFNKNMIKMYDSGNLIYSYVKL